MKAIKQVRVPDLKVMKQRGQPIQDAEWAPWMLATYHPSALLRIPDHDARHEARANFARDLRKVAKHLHALKR